MEMHITSREAVSHAKQSRPFERSKEVAVVPQMDSIRFKTLEGRVDQRRVYANISVKSKVEFTRWRRRE